MSFVVTIWQAPPDTPIRDAATADAVLESLDDLEAPRRNAALLAFMRAVSEHFPTSADGSVDEDAFPEGFADRFADGRTLRIGVATHCRHFDAAFAHAVVAANRQGLHLYDMQLGMHYLADGRCLGLGVKPEHAIDAEIADAAWRRSDWTSGLPWLRERIVAGDREALHDLAWRIGNGLGQPRSLLLAGALMQVAADPDDARRRQRLAILKALPAHRREQQTALRDLLRAASDLLGALDAELATLKAERQRLIAHRDATAWDDETWWHLRRHAEDGCDWSALLLHDVIEQAPVAASVPPWPPCPQLADADDHWLRLAARWHNRFAQRHIAERLLSGRAGYPLDPTEALVWLRRAASNGCHAIGPAVEQLTRKLAEGWDPARDRIVAEEHLARAALAVGAPHVQALRRAAELGHPRGWLGLADAHAHGKHGLARASVTAAALRLAALGSLGTEPEDIEIRHQAELPALPPYGLEEALWLARRLFLEPDPWPIVEDFLGGKGRTVAISGGKMEHFEHLL